MRLHGTKRALPVLVLNRIRPTCTTTLLRGSVAITYCSLTRTHTLDRTTITTNNEMRVRLGTSANVKHVNFTLHASFSTTVQRVLRTYTLPKLRVANLFRRFSITSSATPRGITCATRRRTLFIGTFRTLGTTKQRPTLIRYSGSTKIVLRPS